jgi:hypothetical protein
MFGERKSIQNGSLACYVPENQLGSGYVNQAKSELAVVGEQNPLCLRIVLSERPPSDAFDDVNHVVLGLKACIHMVVARENNVNFVFFKQGHPETAGISVSGSPDPI